MTEGNQNLAPLRVASTLIVMTVVLFGVYASFGPSGADKIGSTIVVYDQARASRVVGHGSDHIRVLDAGLRDPRGIAYDSSNSRLLVADAWEGVLALPLDPKARRPRVPRGQKAALLPPIAICPESNCEAVDHRGLVDDGDGTIFLADAHERRVLVRAADGTFRQRIGGRFDFHDVVGAAAIDDNSIVVTDVMTDERANPPVVSGRLLLVQDDIPKVIDPTLLSPRGVATSPCRDRVYVNDADSHSETWIYYEKDAKAPAGWARAGVLWTAKARTSEDHPVVFRGIVVAAGQRSASGDCVGGEEVFAAGPDGLYIIHPDGTLLAKFILNEPVAGLTWGAEGERRIYMTIGHRLCYLDTAVSGSPRPRLSKRR